MGRLLKDSPSQLSLEVVHNNAARAIVRAPYRSSATSLRNHAVGFDPKERKPHCCTLCQRIRSLIPPKYIWIKFRSSFRQAVECTCHVPELASWGIIERGEVAQVRYKVNKRWVPTMRKMNRWGHNLRQWKTSHKIREMCIKMMRSVKIHVKVAQNNKIRKIGVRYGK